MHYLDVEKLTLCINHLPADQLNRSEWITVLGVAKDLGVPYETMNAWSAADTTIGSDGKPHYRADDMRNAWNSLKRQNTASVGSVIQMTRDKTGIDIIPLTEPLYQKEAEQVDIEQAILQLETLFDSSDIIDVHNHHNETNKMPVGELVQRLRVEQRLPDYKEPNFGYFFGINPLDDSKTGRQAGNVVKFKYALIEVDELTPGSGVHVPLSEQMRMIEKHRLPVKTVVSSGNKSLHFIVAVDAKTETEYSERVETLYNYLVANGIHPDRNCKNANRNTRLAGAIRNGRLQQLVDVYKPNSIWCKDWQSWVTYTHSKDSDLPPITSATCLRDAVPVQKPELIEGILRQTHKMSVSGASKAGKTFLLIELAIALAHGTEWLGKKVLESKVLYLNMELDPADFETRVLDIYKAMGMQKQDISDNFLIWHLRGHAKSMSDLSSYIIEQVQLHEVQSVIIDPIYKTLAGEENNSKDVAAFTRELDKICAAGATVIYCHHHPKGNVSGKKTSDRSSGSSVFGRDADAILDLNEIPYNDLPLTCKTDITGTSKSAWRVEAELRSFPYMKPVGVWFDFPLHIPDDRLSGSVKRAGKAEADDEPAEPTSNKTFRNRAELEQAIRMTAAGDSMTTSKKVAEKFDCSQRTVRDAYLEYNLDDSYKWNNGKIYLPSITG